jgi:hypothetical protein
MKIIIIFFSIVNILWALAAVGLKFIYRLQAPQTIFSYLSTFFLLGLPGLVALVMTVMKIRGYPIAYWHIILVGIILGLIIFNYAYPTVR